MKTNELTRMELEEVTQHYMDDRPYLYGLISLEEYADRFVRKCESCGRLVFDLDENELPIGTNWKGQKYSVCNECFTQSEEYLEQQEKEEEWVGFNHKEDEINE
jgi:hypothetical protein